MRGAVPPAGARAHGGRTGQAFAIFGAVAIALATGPEAAKAQLFDVAGYYLHAAAGMESSPFSEAGAMDFQRIRLMTRPASGAFTFDVAYEHTLTLRSDDLALGRGFEGAEPAAPWLGLQGDIVDRRRVTWAHGLDRLNASVRVGDRTRLTVGRQSISWATTLYFTPADPFVPFDPADPFREYRSGVDALRAVVFLGPFSEMGVVLRPASGVEGEDTLTALLRAQTLLGRWEVSGWGGMLHDEPAIAAATTGTAGEVGLRAEGSLRREDGMTVVRVALGADRRLDLFERDLRAVVEYQHDGFGAGRTEDLIPTALSAPAARGELLVLGRDALVLSTTYQVRPLTSVSLLSLASLRDGSTLLSPSVVHSLTDEASLRVGGFAGLGPGADDGSLGSEHGATPLVGFAALTVFF